MKQRKFYNNYLTSTTIERKRQPLTYVSRSPDAQLTINQKSPSLATLTGIQSPKPKAQNAEKPEPLVGQPHFRVNVDDLVSNIKLPTIDCEGIANCRHEKNGYGDLVILDGEVILDFWRRKIKMTIRRDCILIEQADLKKQMFAREDLPKKFHSLYMFAAKMVDALKQKQKVQAQHSQLETRGSQIRMNPHEIFVALSHKSKGSGSSIGTAIPTTSSGILKGSGCAIKGSFRQAISRS